MCECMYVHIWKNILESPRFLFVCFGLELRDPTTSVSQVLELKTCTSTAQQRPRFLSFNCIDKFLESSGIKEKSPLGVLKSLYFNFSLKKFSALVFKAVLVRGALGSNDS